jgi:hypothetical protein
MRRIASLFLAVTVVASAQEMPQGGGEQVFVTAIEVVADVRDANGNLPAGLKAADFIVIEDGVERTVVGVDYLRAQRVAGAIDTSAPAASAPTAAPAADPVSRPLWQNVLYFETTLANGTGRVAAAREMMNHVDTLTAMGTVDVIFANPTPVALVRNSRDATAIRAALEKVALSSGINQLAAHRRDYLRALANLGSLAAMKARAGKRQGEQKFTTPMDLGPSQPSSLRGEFDSTGTPDNATMDPNSIRPYIDQEIRLINSFRESLLTWLSSYRRHVPRNLLMVTDGFDVDPVEFYGTSATGPARTELRSFTSQLGESATRMAQTLAAGAWITVSIPSDNNADGWVDDATVSAVGRVHASLNRRESGITKAFFIRPLDPLNAIAEVTGGKVVPNSAHLAGVLESLDDRIRVTYQVDRRPDGKPRKIQVKARDAALKVRAAHFATSATPDSMAETRAVGLFKDAAHPGDLSPKTAVEWAKGVGPKKSGVLRAVTDIALVRQLLPPGAKGQFRITLAVKVGRDAVVVNRSAPDIDLAGGVFRFQTPLDLPATATALVLVIEETTTGVWGSTRLDIPALSAS